MSATERPAVESNIIDGSGEMEMLLFRLESNERYGINVFKVREALHCPPITPLPDSAHGVKGISYLRGSALSVIDLGVLLEGSPIEGKDKYLVVAEFNRATTGFLVKRVERIIARDWADVVAPPRVHDSEGQCLISAITRIDQRLVQIVDVEKVLTTTLGETAIELSDELEILSTRFQTANKRIMVVDDSSVARNQIVKTMELVGIQCVVVNSARDALKTLQNWAGSGEVDQRISMVVSDIEMPERDGYAFVRDIRADPRLNHLHILLHSSLSGNFDKSMVASAGANAFLPKFDPSDLANYVLKQVGET